MIERIRRTMSLVGEDGALILFVGGFIVVLVIMSLFFFA